VEVPLARETFEVQAAAYREKDRADQLVKRLAGFGFSAQVVMRDIPERGRWYRVIAGGFENRDKAEGAAELMAAKIRGLKCVVRAAEKEN
jgi:cell division septation protein DedD